MCPHCRQNAPLVYRGVTATCSACGRPRAPLTSSSVNLAGQPSKLGGKVARGFGWATLAGGWTTAVLVFLIFAAVWGVGTAAPWIAGGFLAAVSSLVAWALLRGGKELVRTGEGAEHATKTKAIIALAATRGGTLTALDVAQALDVTIDDADGILTRLAKEQHDLVKVDIDDEGRVLYRFTSVAWASMQPPPPMRVAPSPSPSPRVAGPSRVAPEAQADVLEEDVDANEYGVRAAKRR